MRKKNLAQSIIEYAMFICVLVAALVAMRYYINRGFQGRLRHGGEELGGGYYYSPGGMVASSIMTHQEITETSISTTKEPPSSVADPDARIMVSDYDMNSTRNVTTDETLLSYHDEMRKGGIISRVLP